MRQNIAKFFFLLVIIVQACSDSSRNSVDVRNTPERLPMNTILLTDKSGFLKSGANWKIVKNVVADHQQEGVTIVPGEGVLLNDVNSSDELTPLVTNFEHGDLELEMEFMTPKGSNSGLFFQGRYEIELSDTWNVKDTLLAYCGTIFQNNKDETKAIVPVVNASKAPGLWQQIKVLFRAPRFDTQGNKIASAKFEHVYLNGFLLHKDIQVNGPVANAFLPDEKELGPLVIQADNGTIVVRNIRYKSYTLDSLKLDNIRYTLYENTSYSFPDFRTLKPVRNGTASDLNVIEASSKPEFFALTYDADLIVPVTGEYLFKGSMDEGGEIRIDNQPVIRAGNIEGEKKTRTLIHLTEGKHSLHINYFQATWSANIYLYYEGPGISYKSLGIPANKFKQVSHDPMPVVPVTQPEMIRSFITYKDTVKTHVISVGSPANVHYTFDLNEGSLVKAWKGKFADTYGMWHSRGESQLLQAMNFSIEPADGLPMSFLSDEEAWSADPELYKFIRYKINFEGYPVFQYQYAEAQFEDLIVPSADRLGITRTITVTGKTSKQLWYRIATGDPIILLSNGLYNIGGDFYLKLEKAQGAKVRDDQEIIVPVLSDAESSTIQYSIIW